jgi:hypothetical protein
MKRTIIAAIAVATLAGAAAPAMAAPWQNVNQRQDNLDRRIDQGVRNGGLTRMEAQRLRVEFRDIARLENRYRANGLTRWERRDLDRRFDVLSAKIRIERNDRQDRYGWGYGERPDRNDRNDYSRR